jgi:predicted phosphodiesterase
MMPGDPNPDPNVLVLAGDIHTKSNTTSAWVGSYLESHPKSRVVMVLGNHDYYDKTIPATIKYWKDINLGNRFHFLHNSEVIIDDVRFVGGTLWTDMKNSSVDVGLLLQGTIQDFKKIESTDNKGFVEFPEILREHWETREYLKNALEVVPDGVTSTVVVTHHLPSIQSVAPEYDGSPLNYGYYSQMEHLIKQSDFWIHGHTHTSCSYEVDGAHVYCNPRGHSGESGGFDPFARITVGVDGGSK